MRDTPHIPPNARSFPSVQELEQQIDTPSPRLQDNMLRPAWSSRCEETERSHAESLKQKPSKGPTSGAREGSGIFSTAEVQQRLRAIEAKLNSSLHPRQ
jgi:hypothetical protein